MTQSYREYKEKLHVIKKQEYNLYIQRAKDLLEEDGKVHYVIETLQKAQIININERQQEAR